MRGEEEDLSRLIIERELEKSKNELEKFKGEITTIVADAKVDIGDKAIEKMSQAFIQFRNWSLGTLALLFALTGIGYISVKSTAQRFIESRLNDWLSFDKRGAVLKDTLEQVRMRAVLDSLVIKLARAKSEGRMGAGFTLSEAEEARLIAYMQDPSTSEWDFRDGARILSAQIGPFVTSYTNTKIDQLLQPVFTNTDYKNEKRLILLESLKNYAGMFAYAYKLLDAKDLPIRARLASFDIVGNFDSKRASEYAENNLLKEEDFEMKDRLANYLARSKDDTHTLDEWLAKQKQKQDGSLDFIRIAQEAAWRSGILDADPIQKKKRAERVADLMFSGILYGAKLNICSPIRERDEICFKSNRYALSIDRPGILFGDDVILNAMAEKSFILKKTPEWFIQSMTTHSQEGVIFGLRVEIGEAVFIGSNYGEINKKTSAGSILLTTETRDGKEQIFAGFRSPDGKWIHDPVIKFDKFYQTKLHFAYDPEFMQQSERRLINKERDL